MSDNDTFSTTPVTPARLTRDDRARTRPLTDKELKLLEYQAGCRPPGELIYVMNRELRALLAEVRQGRERWGGPVHGGNAR